MKCDCEIVFIGNYEACVSAHEHGMHGTLLYKRWLGMKGRCFYGDPLKPNKKRYKGRSIGVCKQWSDSFLVFYQDMGNPPFKGASLDRANSDLHYCPHNVSWKDREFQSRNRSLSTDGKYPPGVRFRKDTGKFYAVIWVKNKMIKLSGNFLNKEDAHQRYLLAKKEIHGVTYDR